MELLSSPWHQPHKKNHHTIFLCLTLPFYFIHFFPAFLMFILPTHQTEDFDILWTPRSIPLFWVTVRMVVRRESQSKSRLILWGPEAPVTAGHPEVILRSSLGGCPLFTLCPYSFLSSTVLNWSFEREQNPPHVKGDWQAQRNIPLFEVLKNYY